MCYESERGKGAVNGVGGAIHFADIMTNLREYMERINDGEN